MEGDTAGATGPGAEADRGLPTPTPTTAAAPPADVAVFADQVGVTIAGYTLLPPTSLHARPGEVVAVRGPNGSGKTTILRILAGELEVTVGEAVVLGMRPTERDPAFRSAVGGLLGGSIPLTPNLTSQEHLELVLLSWGEPASDAGGWLARMRLSELADRYPHELSSGQRQMFSLTLALARPCDVLLFDEPEQRLDADRLELIASAIASKAAAGVSVVMATHREALVTATGARVVHLTLDHTGDTTADPLLPSEDPAAAAEYEENPAEEATPSVRSAPE